MTIPVAPAVPSIALATGRRVPQIGLGTYQLEGDLAQRVVGEALDVGYRHIDTAAFYRNERAIGSALASSGIPRRGMFVTTKVWQTDHGRARTRSSVHRSLDQLGVDYLDLVLIHWPAPLHDLYVDTWLALEELQAEGRIRDIGVSNFQREHLEVILALGSAVPVVNQIELHPLFQQSELRAWQEPRSIRTQAWGPLGQGLYSLDEIDALRTVAERTGGTVAQVVIRWLIGEGIVVIPKSSSRARLVENLTAANLMFGDADLAAIRDVNRDFRLGVHPNDHN